MMTANSEDSGEKVARKRRAHKKSRLGCRNCKLRCVKVSYPVCRMRRCITKTIIKCDETRPECKNCMTFRVSCNYNANAPDLEMSVGGTARIREFQKSPYSTNLISLGSPKSPPCLFPFIISDNNSIFELDKQSLDRLERFHGRTVISIGTIEFAQNYRGEMLSLVFDVRADIKPI